MQLAGGGALHVPPEAGIWPPGNRPQLDQKHAPINGLLVTPPLLTDGDPGGTPTEAYSEDRLLGGRVVLRQPRAGLRVAIDAVLLAAAVTARAGERVLDVGCGSGAAALCLGARVAGIRVCGVERDPDLALLARRNVEINGRSDDLEILCADITSPVPGLPPASFMHVMTNPPFRPPGTGRAPVNAGRRAATIEDAPGLAGWLAFCCRMLAPGGTLTLIHRADRLPEILAHLAGRLAGVAVLPLWPGGAAPKPARRILVRGRVGSRAPFRLLPGLVLHTASGDFTAMADAILRDAGPIAWGQD